MGRCEPWPPYSCGYCASGPPAPHYNQGKPWPGLRQPRGLTPAGSPPVATILRAGPLWRGRLWLVLLLRQRGRGPAVSGRGVGRAAAARALAARADPAAVQGSFCAALGAGGRRWVRGLAGTSSLAALGAV